MIKHRIKRYKFMTYKVVRLALCGAALNSDFEKV